MKVLFLDIDGVLNSREWDTHPRRLDPPPGHVPSALILDWKLIDPRAVALLNEVVARTGCAVVLSSTWRIGGHLRRTEAALKWRGAGFDLLDATPDCAQKVGDLFIGATRGSEIQEWLDAHPEVTAFAIVDDNDDMGPHSTRLVQTSERRGIEREHVERLVALLTESP